MAVRVIKINTVPVWTAESSIIKPQPASEGRSQLSVAEQG
jgi:hypothetical protein